MAYDRAWVDCLIQEGDSATVEGETKPNFWERDPCVRWNLLGNKRGLMKWCWGQNRSRIGHGRIKCYFYTSVIDLSQRNCRALTPGEQARSTEAKKTYPGELGAGNLGRELRLSRGSPSFSGWHWTLRTMTLVRMKFLLLAGISRALIVPWRVLWVWTWQSLWMGWGCRRQGMQMACSSCKCSFLLMDTFQFYALQSSYVCTHTHNKINCSLSSGQSRYSQLSHSLALAARWEGNEAHK